MDHAAKKYLGRAISWNLPVKASRLLFQRRHFQDCAWIDELPGCARDFRPPAELITRMIKEAIGGLSLLRLDISGYNLTNNIRFFSTDRCLQCWKTEGKVRLRNPLAFLINFDARKNPTANMTRQIKTDKHFIGHRWNILSSYFFAQAKAITIQNQLTNPLRKNPIASNTGQIKLHMQFIGHKWGVSLLPKTKWIIMVKRKRKKITDPFIHSSTQKGVQWLWVSWGKLTSSTCQSWKGLICGRCRKPSCRSSIGRAGKSSPLCRQSRSCSY